MRSSHSSFCEELFAQRDLGFRRLFMCDSLDDRVSIGIARFLLSCIPCRGIRHVSSNDKLSLRVSRFETRSLGVLCIGCIFSACTVRRRFFFYAGIPPREIKSYLDRDTTRRSSFGGFTVAIIPINRVRPFRLGLNYELQVPPADQFLRRSFWVVLHSSKTLSASRTFPENVMTVSQIPISGHRPSPRQLWLVTPVLSIEQVFLPGRPLLW